MNATPKNLARRSLSALSWNVGSNSLQIASGFVRSWWLALLIPVEIFGIYALATSIAIVGMTLAQFGMEGAFLHRAPESQDESQAAATHFTLKALFTLGWVAALVILAFTFFDGPARQALLVITAAGTVTNLTQTARLILIRRVVHRRLAIMEFLDVLLSAVVAIILAYLGWPLWALLSTNLITAAINLIGLYLWRPVWRPQLDFSRDRIRYFLGFGRRNVLANLLAIGLDRLDDLWTGVILGNVALGFYSRAYQFALYPRKILGIPISRVTGGAYAELKDDRHRLSMAFFRTNALLVRSGFFIAGLLTLIAPEFIRLLLTDKWLPMLAAFRLMLIFTMLDPLRDTVADLFIAAGQPETIVRTRTWQMAVLIAGLFILGMPFGITGVALAVDVMLVVGIGVLFYQARSLVDFSLLKLFLIPTVVLLAGLGLAVLALQLPGAQGSDWRTGLVKAIVFSASYALLLFALEYRSLRKMLDFVRSNLSAR